MVDKWALTNCFTENIQNLGMDTSSAPEPPMEAFNPGLSEVGPKCEILDMIKIRKAQLKFRRTVLLKRQQFRKRVSEEYQGEWKYEELVKRVGLYSYMRVTIRIQFK